MVWLTLSSLRYNTDERGTGQKSPSFLHRSSWESRLLVVCFSFDLKETFTLKVLIHGTTLGLVAHRSCLIGPLGFRVIGRYRVSR